MHKLKMISLISAVLLLTWCSMTKINQSEELTGDTITWEIATGAINSGTMNNDVISWDVIDTTGTTASEVSTDTTVATNTTTATAEDNALKAKIRDLIEKRKIESKSATGLTEEDIQLMTDVLQAIVDETGK